MDPPLHWLSLQVNAARLEFRDEDGPVPSRARHKDVAFVVEEYERVHFERRCLE
jgi:hypothetical protein